MGVFIVQIQLAASLPTKAAENWSRFWGHRWKPPAPHIFCDQMQVAGIHHDHDEVNTLELKKHVIFSIHFWRTQRQVAHPVITSSL